MRITLLPCVLAALACTPPRTIDIPIECQQEDRIADPSGGGDDGETVAWLGGVRLLQRDDKELGTTQGTLGASFYDISNFHTEQGMPLDLSPTCVGITGQPSQTGTRTVVPVGFVRVDGVTGGPITLSTADGGALTYGPVADLLTSSPVTVHIEGAQDGFGSVDFPALTPPEKISVSEPALGGNFNIGDDGVTFKWTPSGAGGQIGIDLVIQSGMTRAVLSCVVKDDGCHKIESGNIEWLRAGGSDPISVFFRRSVSQSLIVPGNVDGGMGASMQLTVETRGKVLP